MTGVFVRLTPALLALVLFCLSGCSAYVEFGYHGKTGRDNRTITNEFYPTQKRQNDQRY